MKKLCLPLLLALSFLLTGCQRRDIESKFDSFSTQLSNAQYLSFTANIRAEYEDKTARFTLSYEEDSEGSTVTVIAPELIAGVTARIAPGGTQLEYDTVVLDTGALDNFGLSPMSSLPRLVQTLKCSHVDSYWEEDGMRVLSLEPTDELKCSVWFEGEEMTPLRAEMISGGRVKVFVEISDWNKG